MVEINPKNRQAYNWRKEFRIMRAMVLALVGAMFFCGFCLGYLIGIGAPLW